jgi:hypothetical protein
MAQLFHAEIAAWRDAQARNQGLAEHLTTTWNQALGEAPTRLLGPKEAETRPLTPPPRPPAPALADAATAPLAGRADPLPEPGAPAPVAAVGRLRRTVVALACGLVAAVLGLAWLALRDRPTTPTVFVAPRPPAPPAPAAGAPAAASHPAPASAPAPAPGPTVAADEPRALDPGPAKRRRGGPAAGKAPRPRPRPAAKRGAGRAWDPDSPVPP